MMINNDLCAAAFYFTAMLAMFVLTSYADEVLLAAQQPFRLTENATIIIEDVDSQKGVVWLEIYNQSQNRTLNSTVLGLGEHLNCSDIDLAVDGIYTGGASDLVLLEINGGRNNSRIALGSPAGSL